MNMEETCERLDDILVEYFSTLKQLYQERAILEQYMKSGFLNLSRARYNMGVKAVGSSQFNKSTMTSLVKVDVEDDSNSVKSFQIKSVDTNSSESETDSNTDSQNTVRKRHPDKHKVPEVESVELKTVKDPENKSKRVDPIKWFGVLVPQNLRKCQSEFKEAVNITGNVVNLQQSLISLQANYRQLLKEKSLLVANVNDE